MTDKRSGAQTAGWIVWWIQSAGAALLLVFLIFGGSSFVVKSINDASVDANYGAAVAALTLFGALFLVIEIALQVLCYFAIKRLVNPQNYLWSIVLIVVGFFGNALYLIPGIWGLVINSSNHEVKPNPKQVDPEE